MRIPRAFLFVIVTVVFAGSITAQPSDYFLSVQHDDAIKNQPVTITVELLRTGSIDQLMLMYRPFGSTEFIPEEVFVTGSTVTVTIPAADVHPPFIEYYFILSAVDGSEYTYPVTEPEFNPEMIPVKYETRLTDYVTILSPQRNETLEFEDVVISVSMFELPETYNKQQTRLYINDRDITGHTVITDDILIAVPSNIDGFRLAPGRHRIEIRFVEENTTQVHSLQWTFNITTPEIVDRTFEDVFLYNVSMRGESRNESLAGTSNWYNRSTINFAGEIPWVRFRSTLHLTNEERATRQPQNRYSFQAETPWLRLHAGDTYPRLPSLILNGRRMRGFFGQLELGWFNLDYATGQTIRGVEGIETDRISAFDESGLPIQPPTNSILVDDTTYVIYSFGTHTRTITAVRPSFGSRDFVQMGFTYLHSQDDVGSVVFGNRPAENLVIGSDLRISLDRRRFEFVGQVAGSMQNTDISRGNLTRDELVDLMGSDAIDQLESFVSLSTLQSFITLNQHLVPFDPTKLSSLAVDVHMRLHYFGNNFQFGYIRRGNDYNSFGLSTLRRDVQGFRLRDRLRLMQNRLYFDVSVERLRDNLNDTKAHTTYFNRYDTSVSYFPQRDLPTITVGYGYHKNDNRVGAGQMAIRDVTNRFFTQLSHRFLWGIQHSGSLSFNMSFRDDQTDRDADVDVYNVNLMVTSTFDDLPLRTNFGFGIYHSKIPFFEPPVEEGEQGRFVRSNFSYYNLILGGEYRLMNNELIINASYVPTFGDFDRHVLQAGAQYYFMRNLSVIFRADYLLNPGARNDMISNLMLRYDI